MGNCYYTPCDPHCCYGPGCCPVGYGGFGGFGGYGYGYDYGGYGLGHTDAVVVDDYAHGGFIDGGYGGTTVVEEHYY